MFSTRLSVISVALLASASGCSDGLGPFGPHEPEPVLYPVLSARGHLTYCMNDPRAPRTPPSEKEKWDEVLQRQAQGQQVRAEQVRIQQGPARQLAIQPEFTRVAEPEPRPVQYVSQADRPDPGPSPVIAQMERQRQEAFERQQWERDAQEQRRQDAEILAQQRYQAIEDAHQEQLRQQAEIQRLHELNQRMNRQAIGAPY